MAKRKAAAAVAARPKTHMVIILDKSGSMAATKAAAISGFNEQVQQAKEDSKTQDILCSLVTFNGEVFEHLWNVPAQELTEANPDDFQPNGNTAMRDAVGYVTQKLLNTTNHEDPNTAYLIVTITDGQTNMDKHYSPDALRELTQGCEATKKWTFNYIGCTKEYMERMSVETGTSVSNMAAWSNKTSRAAGAGMSNARMRQKKYFAERAMGQMASPCYASDEAGVVADYEQEAKEAAPAPVIVNPADMPKIDIGGILLRTPKYEDQGSPTWNAGQALFANSMQVKWSGQDELPPSASQGGGGMNFAAVMPKVTNMVGLAVAPQVKRGSRGKNVAKIGKVRRK